MLMPLANILGPYLDNWLLIAIVALLLFGKRLPEVGRSLGRGIVEFKKGVQGIEDDLEQSGQKPQTGSTERPALPATYKFDPYTGKPLTEEPAQPQPRFDPYTGKPLS